MAPTASGGAPRNRGRAALALVIGLMIGAAARADDAGVRVFGATNLAPALTEIARAYSAESGIPVETVFASSGLLRDRIEAGASADVLASADFDIANSFAASGRSGPVVLMVRNTLCALARKELNASPSRLLDLVLDPAIRVGTSTPKADPGGDYVWEAFQKAEAVRRGAFAALDRKAVRLIGGADSPPVPRDRVPMAYWIEEGRVDLFLYYCTAAMEAVRRNAELKIVPFPPELSVVAEYGLTVLHSTPEREARAAQFALYLLSPPAQAIFRNLGFVASGIPGGAARSHAP